MVADEAYQQHPEAVVRPAMNIWSVVLVLAAVTACVVWARSVEVWAIVAAVVVLSVLLSGLLLVL